MNVETEIHGMSGVRKAAILMASIGDEAAATIFHHLTEEDLQGLTHELARLGTVPKEVTLKILEEYQQLSTAHEHIAQGGHEVATRLLIRAFGENGAKEMVQRLIRSQQVNSSRVESLQRIDPKQLARFLDGEHPQTIALILGHLETKQASALLMCLPHPIRAESVRRLANLRQFSPAMAEKVAIVLNRRLRSVGEQKKKTYSGFQSVADLMNNIDATTSGEILETIEKEEANLAVSIRDLMFTFDDFLSVSEVQLRTVTGAVDKKVLTLALKGASETLRNHFYQTMSSRAIEMMKEEADSLGPVRSKDVAKAQLDIVATARKLELEGKIVLKSEGGTTMFSRHGSAKALHSPPIAEFQYKHLVADPKPEALARVEEHGAEQEDRGISPEAVAKKVATERASAIAETETRLRQEFDRKLLAESQRISAAIAQFGETQKSYFADVESEVVRLALSIAAKILHRESQVDPLLTTAMVQIALGRLKEGARVSIRVGPAEVEWWTKQLKIQKSGIEVTVVADAEIGSRDCILETELGSVNFNLDVQLQEVEKGFLDVLAQRPKI